MVRDTDVLLQTGDNNGKALGIGFSVLLVDCDNTSLMIVSRMLHVCGYKVITAENASAAIHIVENQQDYIDLILTEVHLPDMDKYQYLERLGEISSLPVVILSADNDEKVMLGSFFKGGEFYFEKPIAMNIIKNIWQFSFRNKREVIAQPQSADNFNGESLPPKLLSIHTDRQSHSNSTKCKRKRKDEINKDGSGDYLIVQKKQKLIWTNELHNRFLQVLEILGADNAHPKKILQHMNVPGLKKEHISSHLQKYRLSLKRNQAVQNNMTKDNNPPSAYNSQEEIPQHSTGTVCPPELKCIFCLCNVTIPTYSMFGDSSARDPNHVDSDHNDKSMSSNGQLASQINQLNSSQSNSAGELSSFNQKEGTTDVFVPPCVETSLTQKPEDVQELLQLTLPPLSPIHPEPQQHPGIFGADNAEIDLLDLSKWSAGMFYDILDCGDLW